jgi:hypothetical protein
MNFSCEPLRHRGRGLVGEEALMLSFDVGNGKEGTSIVAYTINTFFEGNGAPNHHSP